MAPKPTKGRTDVMKGPPLRLADEKGQVPGKSPNMCPGLHRTNMVGHEPETQERDRYERVAPFSQVGCFVMERPMVVVSLIRKHNVRTTLCGSEVPQDRWRGRTAGSGMWTRTENLLSWSPSGDSAIPYG